MSPSHLNAFVLVIEAILFLFAAKRITNITNVLSPSPGGTFDNSPAFQRRERESIIALVPKGRLNPLGFVNPLTLAGAGGGTRRARSRSRSRVRAGLGLLVLLGATAASADPIFTTLHNFTGPDGAAPLAGLIQTQDGSLYGTTSAGGASVATDPSRAGYGTIFKMTTDGALTTLYSFNALDGIGPAAELLDGGDGYFYGTTAFGGPDFNGDPDTGYGTIFKISSQGALTTLYNFNEDDGAQPSAPLIRGPDGQLYGTAFTGGAYTNAAGDGSGSVFKLTADGIFTTVASLANTNGAGPNAPLFLAKDGSFYGSTGAGGYTFPQYGGMGTLFRISPDTGLQMLLSFGGTNGARPSGSLVQAPDGTLYGTTQYGGRTAAIIAGGNTIVFFTDYGTVFRITPDGTFSTLVVFDNRPLGSQPSGLVHGPDGNFYGATQWGGEHNLGTLFTMTPAGQLTTLLSFNGTNGAAPTATLLLGRDGNLYGTTSAGGPSYSRTNAAFGTVFRFTMPPELQTVQLIGTTLTVSWAAVPGRSYQLQFNRALTQTNWVDTGNPVNATNYLATGSDAVGADPQRFYRVRLLP